MRLATPAPGEDTLQLEQFKQFDMRTPGAAMGAAYAGAAPAFAAFDRALQHVLAALVLNFVHLYCVESAAFFVSLCVASRLAPGVAHAGGR